MLTMCFYKHTINAVFMYSHLNAWLTLMRRQILMQEVINVFVSRVFRRSLEPTAEVEEYERFQNKSLYLSSIEGASLQDDSVSISCSYLMFY